MASPATVPPMWPLPMNPIVVMQMRNQPFGTDVPWGVLRVQQW
jgi:hypothetical protein